MKALLALTLPLALGLGSPLCPPAQDSAPQEISAVAAPASTVESSPLLQRVCAIGASVTEGFGLQVDFGGRDVGLDAFFEACLPEPSEVLGLGDSWLFQSPLLKTEAAVARALEFQPSLVVGIDFLFWFAYGHVASEESRLPRFELGLEQLARFECPVVVGDIPDMRAAVDGVSPIGPMLFEEQVPEPETLAELNERLSAWAAERGDQVTVVPLAEFTARASSGQALELRGNEWSENDVEDFLQDDLLHPTAEGTCALMVLIFDALAGGREEVEPLVEWNARELLEKVEAQVEKARQ